MGAPVKDLDLLKLAGVVLPSPTQPAVTYRLDEVIGEGAHGVVFLALQRLPQAFAPVVVKVLRPRAVREMAELAGTAISKEVAALRRLSERVPPTPFVVQFLDAGTLRIDDGVLELPWLAVEYVHGGLEGTTLRARVEGLVARTGFSFDLARARSAIKCITAGLTAIHEVGVLHRDVTPGNVLCCGFGETEVFKIADFGLARVSSVSTFGAVLLGTPGYCSPEQSFPDKVGVGPYSDVFGIACTAYFLLTGEPYFAAPSIPEMLVAVQSPERRSIASAGAVSSELRERRAVCLELDRVLARATRADPRERPQSAAELGALLLPLLQPGSVAGSASVANTRKDERLSAPRVSGGAEDFRWTVRHRPGSLAGLCSVGWDSNGQFLAATTDALVYWDGGSFRDVPFDWPWVPRSVHRSGAGRWLLAGDRGVLADFSDGKVERWVSAGNNVHFVAAAGVFDDIAVAAADRHGFQPELWVWIGGRFMEPLPLNDYAKVSACSALSDTSWLVVGESSEGDGLLTEFLPLGHRIRLLARVPGCALRACASQLERAVALAVGEAGYVAQLSEGKLTESRLSTETDFSAVAIDALGREWIATAGSLWTRGDNWDLAWSDPNWTAPFASLMADVGRVVAVTTDGGVLEAEATTSGSWRLAVPVQR